MLDSPRWAGKRIGLFGGTFDPPHEGHLYIARAALQWLALDAVWWLVSPGHPLKAAHAHSRAYDDRLVACRQLVNHPRIIVSDLERQLQTHGTYQLLNRINTYYPRTDFVFIGGMDLHSQFHLWQDWDKLLQTLPVAFFARPPVGQMVRGSHLRGMAELAVRQTVLHRPLHRRSTLSAPQIYWIQSSRLLAISSSQLRAKASNATIG